MKAVIIIKKKRDIRVQTTLSLPTSTVSLVTGRKEEERKEITRYIVTEGMTTEASRDLDLIGWFVYSAHLPPNLAFRALRKPRRSPGP
jgi:hypothetical protein